MMTFDAPERVNNGWPGTGRVDRLVAGYLVLLAVVGVVVGVIELVRTSVDDRHVIGALILIALSAMMRFLWALYAAGSIVWLLTFFAHQSWWATLRLVAGIDGPALPRLAWVSYVAILFAAIMRETNRKRAQPPAAAEGPASSE